jgi:hypothetical protein
MSTPSTTKMEQGPYKAQSTVIPPQAPVYTIASKDPNALLIPAQFAVERSAPASPLTPVTPGEKGVPPAMKRCRNCQELVSKKDFFDVHFPQCKRMCNNCGASVPNSVWKEHHAECAKCRYCDQYISDWKAHKKSCPTWPSKCDHCRREDIPRKDLEAHTLECREQRRRQDCRLCHKSVQNIQVHLKTCAQAPQKVCVRCNASVNKFVYKDHLKIYCAAAEANRAAASAVQAGTETSKDPEGIGRSLEHKGTS